jgi:DNA helicase-2/ATP-dependent DNA helicase PcrA
MSELTIVQRAALDAWRDHRVVVVRACPGAGKTRVFVAALRDELERSDSSRFGVAALSFTNVAQEEIARRLGGQLSAPHFVGTLDSFLWRFVVVPFGHLVGVRRDGPRLVPAPLEQTLNRPEIQYGTAQEKASLFRCHLRKHADGSTGVSIEMRSGSAPGSATQTEIVLAAKRQLWARRGQITHSDSHFIAAEVMRLHGAAIRSVLAKRFRAILVDECQDTNGFMAAALLALLDCDTPLRALVVGDSDQAIYGFGGGSKDILNRIAALPDAATRELNETHRCARRIARVVSALSRRGATVEARPDAPDGTALLLIHDHSHNQPRLDEVMAVLAARGIRVDAGATAVLARKNVMLDRLRGVPTTRCPLSSNAAQRFARAAAALRDRDPRAAFQIASHALSDLVFDDNAPLDELLSDARIERRQWRRAVHLVLVEAARERAGQTWGAWREALRSACGKQATALGRSVELRRLGGAFKKGDGENAAWSGGSDASIGLASTVLFETIHGVKGKEFEHVVLYAPKPHKTLAPCPSGVWWSNTPEAEEREVAFVAASRAKSMLVLAIHEESLAALRDQRPDFVALFEQHPLAMRDAQSSAPKRRKRKAP